MSQYIRHAIAPLDAIIPEIKALWDEPKSKMTYGAWTFNVHSLRLKTFCRAAYQNALECSACKIRAEYFAVESFKTNNDNTSVHVNLYGRKDNGEEVLFTHDHTLARGLGGADNLSNTTMMCFPCNNRKGNEEGHEVNIRRFMTTLSPKAKARHQALLDAKKNPSSAEQVEVAVNKWAANITAESFAKRIDSYLEKFGWKRRQLKEKIDEGVIKFNLYPVRD